MSRIVTLAQVETGQLGDGIVSLLDTRCLAFEGGANAAVESAIRRVWVLAEPLPASQVVIPWSNVQPGRRLPDMSRL